jgi:hypothetical protein
LTTLLEKITHHEKITNYHHAVREKSFADDSTPKENHKRGNDHHHGKRGGRGGYQGRGREFDRHSANPRHDGEKKELVGKGTLGNPLTAEADAEKDVEAEL